MTHICVNKLTITGSDNGLSPDRRQAIICTNGGILLIRTLGTNFSEIESETDTFSSKEMHLKMSSGKWRPFCLGLNVLTRCGLVTSHGKHWSWSTLVQVLAWRLTGAKLLPEPISTNYCQWNLRPLYYSGLRLYPSEQILVKCETRLDDFHYRKCIARSL